MLNKRQCGRGEVVCYSGIDHEMETDVARWKLYSRSMLSRCIREDIFIKVWGHPERGNDDIKLSLGEDDDARKPN